ncbi:hypothetical protein [Maricaulis sp.]|uniref:hypothetical protein n=1 Tax=Maricaulis sp. TaxID=1486257 RepID=UPI002634BDF7|nr:hypothetical protein [Maricaulis sp.]
MFDDKRRLLDWGGHEARANKNQACRGIAARLLRGYRPRHLVLEDALTPTSTRHVRIRRLLTLIAEDAACETCVIVQIPKLRVRQRFCMYGAASKDDIASAICSLYPELKSRLPKKRRPWQSEHYSLAVFEAAALGVTFFSLSEQPR